MLKIRNENLFDLDALAMAALFGHNPIASIKFLRLGKDSLTIMASSSLESKKISALIPSHIPYLRNWWVDNHLVHVLSPNIYRNTSEALESFEYITNNGNFSFTERITVKYAGAAAMYFVSKNLKKKYNITDERAALYEAVETWVDALNGREFLDGFQGQASILCNRSALSQRRGGAVDELSSKAKLNPREDGVQWRSSIQRRNSIPEKTGCSGGVQFKGETHFRTPLGGSKPNLADLAVFGVLRPIRYLRSGRDMVEQTRIGDWYTRMENAVGESSRMKA
ncbi:hypothetical protein DKX38_022112 [Salix brachista]|uniref:GST C-terminal domain-containing protein n=1 Tax=Salix brachista TaxID=2182728 RepID=A0A5N5K3G7_9ROSI|nr:hypothetical protein DKX38_022112 [Salix brachista]